jgi:hypothetical protein
MLKAIGASGQETELVAGAHWIDLCSPTDEEIAKVEKRFDLKVPSKEDLSPLRLCIIRTAWSVSRASFSIQMIASITGASSHCCAPNGARRCSLDDCLLLLGGAVGFCLAASGRVPSSWPASRSADILR